MAFTQHLPSSTGQSALKFTDTLSAFGNCSSTICFGGNAKLCISFNADFRENKMYSVTLIEISGRTRHSYHSDHLGKIHLFCGSSFHLQPKKFKYKMWTENDLKGESLNFLHGKEDRRGLFWRQKNKIKQLPSPRVWFPGRCLSGGASVQHARARVLDSDGQGMWLTCSV